MYDTEMFTKLHVFEFWFSHFHNYLPIFCLKINKFNKDIQRTKFIHCRENGIYDEEKKKIYINLFKTILHAVNIVWRLLNWMHNLIKRFLQRRSMFLIHKQTVKEAQIWLIQKCKCLANILHSFIRLWL